LATNSVSAIGGSTATAGVGAGPAGGAGGMPAAEDDGVTAGVGEGASDPVEESQATRNSDIPTRTTSNRIMGADDRHHDRLLSRRSHDDP